MQFNLRKISELAVEELKAIRDQDAKKLQIATLQGHISTGKGLLKRLGQSTLDADGFSSWGECCFEFFNHAPAQVKDSYGKRFRKTIENAMQGEKRSGIREPVKASVEILESTLEHLIYEHTLDRIRSGKLLDDLLKRDASDDHKFFKKIDPDLLAELSEEVEDEFDVPSREFSPEDWERAVRIYLRHLLDSHVSVWVASGNKLNFGFFRWLYGLMQGVLHGRLAKQRFHSSRENRGDVNEAGYRVLRSLSRACWMRMSLHHVDLGKPTAKRKQIHIQWLDSGGNVKDPDELMELATAMDRANVPVPRSRYPALDQKTPPMNWKEMMADPIYAGKKRRVLENLRRSKYR